MACELTAGFALDCKEGVGGIRAIFLASMPAFYEGGVVTIDATSQEVDGLPTASVYQYVLPKHTGSFTEEVQSSVENGTIFYTQTVTATFFKLTAARRKQLELVAKNRLVVFVLDNNNNIWMVGKVDGAEVTAASTSTGTAKGDLNGYTITFTAEEAHKAYRLVSYTSTPFDNFGDIDVEAGTL
jgi:hypothetical protein